MVSLELAVDSFKHAFLLKLNFIEPDVFDQYRKVGSPNCHPPVPIVIECCYLTTPIDSSFNADVILS